MDNGRSAVVKPKHNMSDAVLKMAVVSAVWMLGIAGVFAQAAGAITFQNTNAIILPAAGPALPPYPGSPYPSSIGVSNLSGEITRVTVNLVQFTHSYPDAVDIMLVGPAGQKVLLMSDAGGDNVVSGLVLNFSDSSTVFLPDSGRIVSGSYRPSNFEPAAADTFPPPVPSGTLGSLLAVFNGTNPNGLWRLYAICDSQSPNGGFISGGWQLSITTTNAPPVILKQPQDATISAGDTAQFVVDVSGTPPLEYQWMRNGEVYIPFGQGTDTLRIFNAGPQHAGIYSVIVRNAAAPGGVQSREASLFVRGPIQSPSLPDIIVPEDADITFYAAPVGDPPFRYQWRRNGVWLTSETNSTLRRLRVKATDGGHFSVIVQNGGGARTSQPGLLKVLGATEEGSPTDEFERRPRFDVNHGIVQGNSEKASSEPGEPLSFGGGKTMWLQWQARQSGVVRFSLLGSAFDTLLTVFPENGNGQLETNRVVTKDDDRAGFYTSQLDFTAQEGRSYFVQVDGFGLGGSGGEFTLKWDLDPLIPRTPVIQTNPVPVSVRPGQRAVFSATVEQIAGVPSPSFLWFFNGTPLTTQTSPTLIIQNAQKRDVGFYSLRVRNEFGITIFSPAIPLQLGFPTGFFFFEKQEMMFLSGGQFVPIGVGASVFTQAPWPSFAKEKDPTPCDSPLVGTLWQGLTATNTGRIQVTTTGSTILNRMAVYRLTGTTNDFGTNNPPLVCDVTSAGAGLPCVATFDGIQGTNYTVVVEGITAPTGVVQVTSMMGYAPAPTNSMKYWLVFEHGSIQLSMPGTNWFPAPACQWYYNSVPITDATNATLDVTDFLNSDIGTYSVRMSNFAGTNTCNVAYLDIAPPFALHYSWVSGGGGSSAGFKITGSNAAPFVLQTAIDLMGSWLPIATNPDPSFVLYYTNKVPASDPQRFYRAVPWSPGP